VKELKAQRVGKRPAKAVKKQPTLRYVFPIVIEKDEDGFLPSVPPFRGATLKAIPTRKS